MAKAQQETGQGTGATDGTTRHRHEQQEQGGSSTSTATTVKQPSRRKVQHVSAQWSNEFFRGLSSERRRAEAAQAELEAQRWHSVTLAGATKSGWRSDHTALDAIGSIRAEGRAARIRREYDDQLAKADGYLAEIREANPANGSKWAEVLRLRYVVGHEWSKVAERMGACDRSVYLWHRTALDWLDAHVAPGL